MSETSSLREDWEFNATFTIFLYNQISGKYGCFRVNERCFNEATSKWGFPKLISKKMLIDQSTGYLVDDNIVLGAEVLVIKRNRVIETVNVLKPTKNPQICEWKIQEFSKWEDDRVWISEEFTIRNVDWKMKLYSTGNSNSKGRELSMELVCASADTFNTHQKVKAEFYMRLKGELGVVRSSGKLSHWFTSSDKSFTQSSFISFVGLRFALRKRKDGFLVDDCCTLQIEISVQLVV
ncbi:hypothetical protein ACP275_10G179600 [Erythranthe tilingii]